MRDLSRFTERVRQVRRQSRRLALGLAVAVALTLPSLVFLIGLNYQYAHLQRMADISADRLSAYVARRPRMWSVMEHRLVEVLYEVAGRRTDERVQFHDLEGELLASSGENLPFELQANAAVSDGIQVVGRVRFSGSPRSLYRFTGLTLLFGSLLGAIAYALLRRLPLRAIDDSLSLLEEAHGELARYSGDLEQQVAARTVELEEAVYASEAASRAKSTFLANMSHEIRTPMHAIASFARLGHKALDQAHPEKLRHYCDRVSMATERLTKLIDGILDLSRLEAGKMDVDFQRQDLVAVLREAIDEYRPLLDDKQISLLLQLNRAGARVDVDLDAALIGRVVRNLLSNAIKFSPEGGQIECELRLLGDPADGGLVQVAVLDQGVGIPPDEVDFIFEKFNQSSRTASGAGGTGLGLAICREIVAVHGGSIGAGNRTEGGARFSFSLPCQRVTEAPVEVLDAEG